MRDSYRSAAIALPVAPADVWTLAVVFAILLSAAAAPILSTPIAPLADYVNHLARMHVLAHIADHPALAEAYHVDWAIIPNLTMDLLVPALARRVGIYPAGQLFLLLEMALLVSGPMALYRVLHGHWSAWPLVVVPFVYNGVFLFGLVNYLFGVGLAIWGAAAWIALSDHPLWRRAAFAVLLVPCLFFCHLFAVGLFGMTIFAWELARLAALPGFGRRLGRREMIVTGLAVVLPFVPAPFLLAAGPTMGLAGENYWESVGKIDGLAMALQAYSDLPDLAVIGAVAGGVIWLARQGRLALHPAGLAFLCLSLLVYLAMPRMLFGSWLADQRLPTAVLFLTAGFVRFTPGHGAERNLLMALVLGASVVRFADVAVHWRALDHDMTEFHQSLGMMGPGARVLVAYADDAAASHAVDAAISHAPCVAVIERDAAVSTLFTVPGKQILDLQPDWRGLVDREDGEPPTVSQLLATTDGSLPGRSRYWDAWAGRYDYLYVLYSEPGDANPDPDHLTTLAHGRRFQLYAVRPEPLQDEADL